MNTLQKALAINAIFSGTSGLILITIHKWIATVFGTNNHTVFLIVGIALLLFSGTIYYEIKKLRASGILAIIIQDIVWVIGSIILIFLNPFHITKTGNYIIGIVAIIVLAMAINQYSALRKRNK